MVSKLLEEVVIAAEDDYCTEADKTYNMSQKSAARGFAEAHRNC